MGKSLTETAKAILMKEGVVPSVSSSDSNPDRDVALSTPNKATLRPGSQGPEGRFSTPGSTPPSGGASVTVEQPHKPGDGENVGAKVSAGQKKDTTIKGANSAGEKPKKAEMMEEDFEELDEDTIIEAAQKASYGKDPEHSVKMSGKQIGTVSVNKKGNWSYDHPASGNNEDGFDSKREAAKELKLIHKTHKNMIKRGEIDNNLDEQIEAYIEQLVAEGHDEDTIMEAIEHYFGEQLAEQAEETDGGFVAEEEESYQVDMSEHIEALFAGEELSEDFKAKATAIFEAAVKSKIEEEIAALEAAYSETLEEHIEQIQEELSSNVDDYLNYVVEQWVSENEVAIEAGLRSELTEEFISGLRNLFAEHYIDIPEDKVSVVEEMGVKVAELEEKLNEEIERNVQLNKVLNESKQKEIVAELCEGLTSTQAAKLKSLSEGLEFTDVNEFSQKVNILRESYFNENVNSDKALDKAEVVTDGQGMISEELQGPMAAYVRTLGKKLPN